MDLDTYLIKLTSFKRRIPKYLDKDIFSVLNKNTEDIVKNRIFVLGKDINNKKIGEYSKKSIVVSKSNFISKSNFKAKKGNKTLFLNKGYKELREIQNLKTNYVNLVYSGELKKSYKIIKTSKGMVVGFSNIKSGLIAKSLEKKYKKSIFSLSNTEINDMSKYINNNMKKLKNNHFNGR